MSGKGAPAARAGEVAAPLREQVLVRLREAILEFRLEPGQRLIERELIERMGVSRTTIREALRQLAAEGLVRMIPHSGAVVSQPSTEEVAELYELRAAIEALAGRCFVRHASPAQVRALGAAHEQLARTSAGDVVDMRSLLAAQDEFYAALLDGAGNRALRDTLAGLQSQMRILRAGALATPERVACMVRESAAIVAAAEVRDEEAAARACAEHVAQAGTRALGAHVRRSQHT